MGLLRWIKKNAHEENKRLQKLRNPNIVATPTSEQEIARRRGIGNFFCFWKPWARHPNSVKNLKQCRTKADNQSWDFDPQKN